VADPGGFDLDAAWDAEWQQNLLTAALERVKRRVDPAHYQIFDCTVVKEWSALKTATDLGVNIAKVYLVKHRVSALVKKELLAIEKER
jgi:RNA polymerase sigma-70 factor (ECF subfamily)